MHVMVLFLATLFMFPSFCEDGDSLDPVVQEPPYLEDGSQDDPDKKSENQDTVPEVEDEEADAESLWSVLKDDPLFKGTSVSSYFEKIKATKKNQEYVRAMKEVCVGGGIEECMSKCFFGTELASGGVAFTNPDCNPRTQECPGLKGNTKFKGESKNPAINQIDLIVTSLGVNSVFSHLVAYNLLCFTQQKEEAEKIFVSDPVIAKHTKDAEVQSNYYEGIAGRTINTTHVNQHPYNGNYCKFVKEQFYMNDDYCRATEVVSNIQSCLVSGKDDCLENTFSGKILDEDGKFSQKFKDGKYYLSSDSTQDASLDQLREIQTLLGTKNNEEILDFLKSMQDKKEEYAKYIEILKNQNLAELKDNRLIDDAAKVGICRLAGSKGGVLPFDEPECKDVYQKASEKEEGLDVAKLSEQRKVELDNFLAGIDEKDKKYILAMGRFEAMQEIAQMDIRNNPEQFQSDQTNIMDMNGGISINPAVANSLSKKSTESYGGGSSGGSFDISSFSSDSHDSSGADSESESATGNNELKPSEKAFLASVPEGNGSPVRDDSKYLDKKGGILGYWSEDSDADAFSSANGVSEGGFMSTRNNPLHFAEELRIPLPHGSDGDAMIRDGMYFCGDFVRKTEDACEGWHSPLIYTDTEDASVFSNL